MEINRLNSKVAGSKVPRYININPRKGELNWDPPHIPGETNASAAIHNRVMRDEAAKLESQQDKMKIAALMKVTYSFHRELINKKVLVREIKKAYPALF